MTAIRITLLLIVLCIGKTQAQSVSALSEGLSLLQSKKGMAGAQVALVVYDMESKKEIFVQNPTEWLTPASNTKLFTTAAALKILGPKTTLTTDISYNGIINSKGILQGSLIVKGGIDPSLGSEYLYPKGSIAAVFEKISSVLNSKGIKGIKGKILIDVSNMPEIYWPASWLKEDIGNYYGCPVACLNIGDNQFKITVAPGIEGKSVTISSINPEIKSLGLQLENKANYGAESTGDKSSLTFIEGTNTVVFEGTVGQSTAIQVIKGSIPNPVAAFASQLMEYFNKNSYSIKSWETSSTTVKNSTLLGTIESPTIEELCRLTNHLSLNHYAEALQLAVLNKCRLNGTIPELYPTSAAINAKQFQDASGLSPKNMVSPRQIVALLNDCEKQNYSVSFINSLPLLGISGTVKNIAANTEVAGKIRVKSGSGNGVFNLSGYVMKDDKPLYSFSFMINHTLASNSELKTYAADIMLRLGKMIK